MARVPTSILSAAGLLGGFSVARYSHNRKLGGALWAGAGLACAPAWRKVGVPGAVALGSAYATAMGGSHPLAKRIGPWRAVLAVTAAMSALSWAVVDRSPRATGGAAGPG